MFDNSPHQVNQYRKLWEIVFENNPNAMWLSDQEGNLLLINKACQKLVNVTPEEVIGRYSVLKDNIVEEQGKMPLVRSVFKENKTVNFELYYDSSQLYLNWENPVKIILDVTISPVLDSEGNLIHALIMHKDLTQQRAYEEILKRSEAERKMILDALPDYVSYIDKDYHYLWANKALLNSIGLTLQDIEGKKCYKVIWGNSSPCENCRIYEAIEHRKSIRYNTPDINGSIRDTITIPVSENNEIIGIVEIARDISDRHRLEKALESLHEYTRDFLFKKSFEEIAELTFKILKDTLGICYGSFHTVEGDTIREIYATEVMNETFTQYTNEKGILPRAFISKETQLIPDTRLDPDYVIAPLTNDVVFLSELAVPIIYDDQVIALINAEDPVLNRFTKEDQTLIEIIARIISVWYENQELYQISMFKSEIENRYKSLIDLSPVAIMTFSILGNVTSCNKATVELTGYPVEEILGKHFTQLKYLDETTIKLGFRLLADLIKGQGTEPLEFPYRTKTGERRWARADYRTIQKPSGGKELLVVIEDITVSRNFLESIKKSEQRYRTLIESGLDAISVVLDGKIAYCNKQFLALLGYKKQEDVIGKSLLDYIEPSYHDKINKNREERKKGYRGEYSFEYKLRRSTGELIEVEGRTCIIDWDGQEGTIGYLRDISEKKKWERRLSTLYNHTVQLSTETTIDGVYQKTFEALQAALDGVVFNISIIKEDHIEDKFWTLVPINIPLSVKSIVTRAARTKKSQLVNDVRLDPDYLSLASNRRDQSTSITSNSITLLSELAVPVLSDNNVIAVINVESTKTNAFTISDKEVMESLAANVGNAISKIRNFDKLIESESELKETINQLKTVTSVTPERIFFLDLDLRIRYINHLLDGSNKDDIIGKHIYDFLPESSAKLEPIFAKLSKTYEVENFETVYSMPSGDIIYFETSAVPLIIDEKTEGYVLSSRNITERVQNEQKRLELERQLLEEQIKTEQAVEMDRLKTSFMSTATHEIRTPLTSILGYIELIDESKQENDMESVFKYYEILKRNAERLSQLTENLLDLQRIESRRLELSLNEFSIKDTINMVLNELAPLHNEDAIEIIPYFNIVNENMYADNARIHQVLINLLTNAVKFSPPQSKIRLEINETSKEYLIKIKDQGIGFSPEERIELFKPFPDIEPLVKGKGSGLGLSICKGIIDLHGGKIWAESDGIGKGATFIFTIPIRP